MTSRYQNAPTSTGPPIDAGSPDVVFARGKSLTSQGTATPDR